MANKIKTVGAVIDALVDAGAIHETTVVEVRANHNVKWRGRADNYPVYLDSRKFVDVIAYDEENDVLYIKASM